MPPQQECRDLCVGLFFVSDESKQCGYICAVCRKLFHDVKDFQHDFMSHDRSTSRVNLPINIQCNVESKNNLADRHEMIDIPLETFISYVDLHKTQDFIQTVNKMKLESSELQQNKGLSEKEADISDSEVTAAETTAVYQDEENTSNSIKKLPKKKPNQYHRKRGRPVKKNVKKQKTELDMNNYHKMSGIEEGGECLTSDHISVEVPSSDKVQLTSEFRCRECPWKSGRHFNYHRHMFTHSHQRGDVGPLTCDYCKKILRPDTGKSGYGQQKVNCTICGTGPLFQSRLVQHMIKMHNITVSPKSKKPVYYCEQCPYVTVKQTMYKKHMLKHQMPDYKQERMLYMKAPRLKKQCKPKTVAAHMCDQCTYTTNRSDLMKQHLLKHTPEDIVEYQCESCDFIAMTEKGLTIHSKVHKRRTFPCSLCPADNSMDYNEKTFPLHLSEEHHLMNKPFCNQCGVLADDEQNLVDHMIKEHQQAETVYYVCYVCGVASDTKEAAKNHFSKHSEEDIQACIQSKGAKKPESTDIYGCDDCVYRTDNPLAIRRHKLIHKKRANVTFSCDSCHEVFAQLSPYNAHLMKKHSVKSFSYQCKMCGRMQQSSGALKKHMSDHLKVKEIFGCDQCGYEAGRRWNLLRHKEITHKSQLYACDHCDYITRSVPRIADHFKHVHLVEPPPIIQKELAKEGDKGASLADIASKKRREYLRQKQYVKRELKPQKKTVCEICGKLVLNSLTEQHRNAHFGLKPFHCHYEGCQHETLTGSALAEHIRRRHLNINRTNSSKMYSCGKCSYLAGSESELVSHHINCSMGQGDDVGAVTSKEETDRSDVTEEVIADASVTLASMQPIVMETMQGAVLQQQVNQSDGSIEASGNQMVQIPMDENTALLIEQYPTDMMIVPQMVSQGMAANRCSVEVRDTQHEELERELIADGQCLEPEVTEVYMIIPTSTTEQINAVIK